jgi:hypothetical protein
MCVTLAVIRFGFNNISLDFHANQVDEKVIGNPRKSFLDVFIWSSHAFSFVDSIAMTNDRDETKENKRQDHICFGNEHRDGMNVIHIA